MAIIDVMGVLYVVATPIGNLEDITLRALRVLREVRLVAAEDTRTTAKLLARYDIHVPMVSFFDHNELVRLEEILLALEAGDVALVSDAGTPTISDPGYRLVRAAVERDIAVIPIPGPSSVVSAMSVSGLPTDSFLFVGFLPRRTSARRKMLAALRELAYTVVCFEAPHRLQATLGDMSDILGDRSVAICCELTKLYEQVWRGRLSDSTAQFSDRPPRGEYTLVVEGASEVTVWSEEQVSHMLTELAQAGMSRRDAVHRVAILAGRSKRDVYRLAIGPDRNSLEGKDHA